MNILFLTLAYPEGDNASNIYVDLMREISDRGNNVYVATALERRSKLKTNIKKQHEVNVLRIKTLNIQKTNIIEKGISTVLIEKIFCNSIKKYFKNVKFDLIIYSTPPITFAKVIEMIKRRDGAKSYLLLKDIFPQNAVDIKMIKENGILHKFFLSKEKKLYRLSDYIGCMSEKNKEYILSNNKEIDSEKVEVCPNSIKPKEVLKLNNTERNKLRKELGIEKDSLVVIYGGNLGKPQGIDFLIKVLASNKDVSDIQFLIIGNGTEFSKLDKFINGNDIKNVVLKASLPKEEYEEYLKVSDLGLILLDNRFKTPNFPSRLLSYMEFSLPIIAATDTNTDIKECITEGKLGKWCESGDLEKFNRILDGFIESREELDYMSTNSRKYLEENFIVNVSADIILEKFDNLEIDKDNSKKQYELINY